MAKAPTKDCGRCLGSGRDTYENPASPTGYTERACPACSTPPEPGAVERLRTAADEADYGGADLCWVRKEDLYDLLAEHEEEATRMDTMGSSDDSRTAATVVAFPDRLGAAMLLQRTDMVCEKHPSRPWPHSDPTESDGVCAGPGMLRPAAFDAADTIDSLKALAQILDAELTRHSLPETLSVDALVARARVRSFGGLELGATVPAVAKATETATSVVAHEALSPRASGGSPDLRTVLLGLMKESAAVLALAEPMLREEIGYTNLACFKRRIEEAGAALSSVPSSRGEQKPQGLEHVASLLVDATNALSDVRDGHETPAQDRALDTMERELDAVLRTVQRLTEPEEG
jgi:hypothetical protein